MLDVFKIYGQRYALDTKSGAVHMLSDIESDMLMYLSLPFETVFPSALRYDLAKYESEQLKAAYFRLKGLYEDGVILKEEGSPKILPDPTRIADKTVTFSGTRFVFASEVIKAADEGYGVIAAIEDENAPVKESDYDIIESEYERVAKEIIKRKSGRNPFPVFEFAPFSLGFERDTRGYSFCTSPLLLTAYGESGSIVNKKLLQCAVAVYFEGQNA